MPERLHLSRAKGSRLPADAVNVARPGKWGNPFRVGRDGTAEDCVRLYRHLVLGGLMVMSGGPDLAAAQRATIKTVRADWRELRGRRLACWCRLDRPCHADVLAEAVAAFEAAEIKEPADD